MSRGPSTIRPRTTALSTACSDSSDLCSGLCESNVNNKKHRDILPFRFSYARLHDSLDPHHYHIALIRVPIPEYLLGFSVGHSWRARKEPSHIGPSPISSPRLNIFVFMDKSTRFFE